MRSDSAGSDTMRFAVMRFAALACTVLRCKALLRCITFHNIILHSIAVHCIALHGIGCHWHCIDFISFSSVLIRPRSAVVRIGSLTLCISSKHVSCLTCAAIFVLRLELRIASLIALLVTLHTELYTLCVASPLIRDSV